jgi:phosphoenolpyruvate carboxylase
MALPTPIRKDVRKLGGLLGTVIQRHSGGSVFDRVEELRSLSKRARADDPEAARLLTEKLAELPPGEALPVARAFSSFLTLANIVETHHRLHSPIVSAEVAGGGDCSATFASLIERGIAPDRLYETVAGLEVELVLTAHPTQVVRRSLLQRYAAIASVLEQRDRSSSDGSEFDEALLREITTIWDTDEVIYERPTPLDEARGGFAILEQELWVAIPLFCRRLDDALIQTTGRGLPLLASPIRFGSWMGGDRDGNPNVTPETTERATWLGRWTAADLLAREVETLRTELPISSCSDELRKLVPGAREPYREFLRAVRDKLEDTRSRMGALVDGRPPPARPHYESKAELIEPLLLVHRSLCETGHEVIARGRLLDLLRRVQCFGLTMVRLDIRQDSERHTEAVDAITRYLGMGSYAEWDEDQRIEFLKRELESKRPLIADDMPVTDSVRDVLQTLRVASRIGPEALGAYVISMAKRASDVLTVELLQKAVGNRFPQRVVPLFETISDLESAGAVMDRLFSVPWYRERIQGRQEIMIGYSDSAKDGGRLAANWGLYRAQEEVVAVCEKHGVQPTLFHGRGGTVARGGGPTHLAIQSQPPGSVSGRLRVTEQGEMVQAKFGAPEVSVRTLDIYAAATTEATLLPPRPPEASWRVALTELAETSCERYRGIVYGNPKFIEYFRHATPEVELGRLNIGSRPARRRSGGGIESLRAIPWIFAWTQNRLCLPAWLGVGAALESYNQQHGPKLLQEMYDGWPFFRSTVDLIEMVAAKSDLTSAERYDVGLVPAELQPLGAELRAELQRTIDQLLGIGKRRSLLEGYPEGRQSLALRDPYLDPINVLQVELLARLRRMRDENVGDSALWAAFVVTVNGIAAGMRNTG